MKKNPLQKIEELGQSIWLDFISRKLLNTGKLKKLIEEDSLRGMTSNPSIFEKSIAENQDYDQDIQALAKKGANVNQIYETLTQKDVRDAADQFRSVYDQTQHEDGYVSLEVNPHLSHDTQGTIEEARRLWKAVDRPNIFIKVPATKEGLPAITQLISEGINVNVTLLFGLTRYKEVAEAYLAGLEAFHAKEKPLKEVVSVASFFLSRIDVLLDPIFEKIISQQASHSQLAKQMQGQIAISSAKIAYQMYEEIFNSDRFKKLAEKGAQKQRLLWASTSTKNPAYSDIKYVEALIGPETVNTLPLETIEAYRDHGDPQVRLNLDVEQARHLFFQLSDLDIQIDQITQQLEDEGVEKFNKSYDQLIETLKKKLKE